MNKNYYYCFFCLAFIRLLGMNEEEEKASLPKMNTLEMLKNYGKDELYKGFLFSTIMTGVLLTTMYGLKKPTSQYSFLESLPHANKKLLGGAAALTYFIPQIINLKTYQRLSTTDDFADFKVKDESLAYTKYCFRPNSLKVLAKRLSIVNIKSNALKSLTDTIEKEFSPSNLRELDNYTAKISSNIEKNTMRKITALIENSTYNWNTLYSLYQELNFTNKEEIIEKLKEKIKKFDQEQLVKIFLEVVENIKELKENFESLENFCKYDSLENFCTFIAQLDGKLEELFSELYFNNKLNTLNENNKTKIQFIPVILTHLYLDKNIDARSKKLSEKLQNFSHQEIIDFIDTCSIINNVFKEKLRHLNQTNLLIEKLKIQRILIKTFNLNFYLEFKILCNPLKSFNLDHIQLKIKTCQNVIASLSSIKKNNMMKHRFNSLLSICKEPLSTYIKDNKLKNSLNKHFSEKDNEKKVLQEILDEA